MGKTIVVASGKGGTGKTFFSANLGAFLAMEGKKVALIDMDMGLRNLDLYLGLENRIVYNIMDVLSGVCKIKQALVKDKRFENLFLIAASPNNDKRDITTLHMEVLCEKLKEQFDYIIIDAPAGIGDGFYFAASGADNAIIVTDSEPSAIRDADTVDRELMSMGVSKRCCVINKVKVELMSMGVIPNLEEISKNLRMQIIGIIQYDDNILISTNKGVPIVIKKGTYIEKNFGNIVNRIVNDY